MKIELVPIPEESESSSSNAAEFLVLKVSGAPDPSHEVLQRARELAVKSGSKTMLEAVDESFRTGLSFSIPDNQ